MIELDAVGTRGGPLARAGVTARFAAGAHSVVGAPSDGGPQLLAVLAGRIPARRGRVRVLNGAPTDLAVRREVAFVPLAPSLPDALRVEEVLTLASRVRGEDRTAASSRLEPLGLGALATRFVRSLTREEVRAVALAEALSSRVVRVVLVEEPLAVLDPRAASGVAEGLRRRASEGCTVVVATASVRDGGALADDHLLLRAGTVAAQAASLDELAEATPGGARMRVVSSDAAALVAAAARETDVLGLSRHDDVVVARGASTVGLAAAMGRAVIESGVQVFEMRLDPPGLDEARASAEGALHATYEAARRRALARLALPPTEGAQ